jgi:ABC-type uncharacterized transport system involved in gliding motility auxiliary subunit
VVETLNLGSTGRVPDDAKAVMIAGPKSAFQESELKALSDYLDGQGRLFLMVDALTETNVAELLNRWDLTIGNGIAIDPVNAWAQDPTAILVLRYGLHTIVKDFGGQRALFPYSTTIQIPEFIKRGVDVNGLAITSGDRSWLETERTIRYDDGVDKKGPLTLALAVEQVENPPAEQPPPGFEDPNKRVKNRAVIFGSSEAASNGVLELGGANRDLVLNSLNWITQSEQLISTRPKIEERRTLFLTPVQQNFVFFSSVLFFPALLLGAGLVIWWIRR